MLAVCRADELQLVLLCRETPVVSSAGGLLGKCVPEEEVAAEQAEGKGLEAPVEPAESGSVSLVEPHGAGHDEGGEEQERQDDVPIDAQDVE